MNPNKALQCLSNLSLKFLYNIDSSSSFCKFIHKTAGSFILIRISPALDSAEPSGILISQTALAPDFLSVAYGSEVCSDSGLIGVKVWAAGIKLFPGGGICTPYCDSGIYSGSGLRPQWLSYEGFEKVNFFLTLSLFNIYIARIPLSIKLSLFLHLETLRYSL